MDPFDLGKEGGSREVVEIDSRAGGEADEEGGAEDAEVREARIDEIERALSSFGRRREQHDGGQRYGRRGRRGR